MVQKEGYTQSSLPEWKHQMSSCYPQLAGAQWYPLVKAAAIKGPAIGGNPLG